MWLVFLKRTYNIDADNTLSIVNGIDIDTGAIAYQACSGVLGSCSAVVSDFVQNRMSPTTYKPHQCQDFKEG